MALEQLSEREDLIVYEHRITPLDFQAAWGVPLSPWVVDRIANRNMQYAIPTPQERDQIILQMLKVLKSDVPTAGKHRVSDWERGWSENVAEFDRTRDPDWLVPKYFGKHPVVRWRGDLVKTLSDDMEYNMFACLTDWVFDTRIDDGVDSILEFGCGTGHNLRRLRQRHPAANLWGLDWVRSSQESVARLAQLDGDGRLQGSRFDYFEPDFELEVPLQSTFLTLASLEQTGSEFKPFIDWALEKRPKRVIHIEPIGELLDGNRLLDYLSISYFDRRNYLSGLLDHLRWREGQGELSVIEASRTHIGSMFVDGYSLIVWEPR